MSETNKSAANNVDSFPGTEPGTSAAAGMDSFPETQRGQPAGAQADFGLPEIVALPPADPVPSALAHHPRYRVLQLLGRGGMGTVYLAEHTKMGRRVALKVIHTHLLQHPGVVERFHQEVRAASRLNHPNIVTAYDADEAGAADTIHFLVMEYVEGENLAQYTDRHGGRLPVAEACQCVRQAALGLQHAWEQGMIHRDLKPHNLIRSSAGQVKILDFGLARLSTPDEQATSPDTGLTRKGMLMGTVDYMAPEQADDSRTVDIRADIYSLGCTLYQLLAGQLPYPGGSVIDKFRRRAAGPPPPLQRLRPDVPPAVAAIVETMMAPRPEDRFQTPAALAAALAPFSTPVEAAAGDTAVLPRPAPPRRRWPLLVALVGLLVLVGLTALGLVLGLTGRTQGQVTVISDDLAVPILVQRDGATVAVLRPQDQGTYALDSGEYTLQLEGNPPGLVIEQPVGPLRLGPGATERIIVRRRPPARPDPAPPRHGQTLDYREIHGADAQALQKWMDELAEQQFRPVVLNVQAGRKPSRFNAVAIRDHKRIPFRFLKDVAATGASQAITDLSKKFRPYEACEYFEGTEVKLALLGLAGAPKSYLHYAADLATITRALRPEFAPHDMRPTSFSSIVQLPNIPSIRCLLGPNQGFSWKAHVDLDAGQLQQQLAEYRRTGWRPDRLVARWTGSDYRFFLSVINTSAPLDWSLQMDLSTRDYEKALAAQEKSGFRPMLVTSYGYTGHASYAVIWSAYRSPGAAPAAK